MFETYENFAFAPELRASFAAGTLIETWRSRYPHLFDAADVRVARNQAFRGYHFVEWFTAVQLLETHGLYSLQEGYTYASHTAKRARLLEIAGQPLQMVLAGVPAADRFRSLAATEAILATLGARGVQFVTVPELVAAGRAGGAA